MTGCGNHAMKPFNQQLGMGGKQQKRREVGRRAKNPEKEKSEELGAQPGDSPPPRWLLSKEIPPEEGKFGRTSTEGVELIHQRTRANLIPSVSDDHRGASLPCTVVNALVCLYLVRCVTLYIHITRSASGFNSSLLCQTHSMVLQ